MLILKVNDSKKDRKLKEKGNAREKAKNPEYTMRVLFDFHENSGSANVEEYGCPRSCWCVRP